MNSKNKILRVIGPVLIVLVSLMLLEGCALFGGRMGRPKRPMPEISVPVDKGPAAISTQSVSPQVPVASAPAPAAASPSKPSPSAPKAAPMGTAKTKADMEAAKTQRLTLKECVDWALQVNRGLDSADKSIESAEWSRQSAYKNFLPKASSTYSYTGLDEIPYTVSSGRKIQTGTRNNFKLGLTISQPIFTGFATLSAYELSKLGLDAAAIAREQTRLDIVLQAKSAYYQVLEAQANLKVANQSVTQLQAQLNVAKNFFDVGMVPKNDVLQAEVRLAQAVQNRILAENQLLFTISNLNTVLRRPLDEPVALEDAVGRPHFEKGIEECLNTAVITRPEILNAKKQLDITEQQVRLAKSGYYPSVSVAYNLNKNGKDPNVKGDDYHDGSAWNVGAVASWNVWEWGQTSDDVQVAMINVEKARNAIVQVEDNVRLGVKQAFLSVQSAEKNIIVAQKAITQAEENYRMFLERYREQVATSTELIDAQTLLTSAGNQYNQALYGYHLAKAQLERAMGVEFMEVSPAPKKK